MESNDNGAYPEVQIRKPHFSHGDPLAEDASGKFEGQMTSGKSGAAGSRPVPESERKKAESKTSASRERTLIPEDQRL